MKVACEFVSCVTKFVDITTIVPLIEEKERKNSVLPVLLKSSSDKFMASKERIMVSLNWFPGRMSGSGLFGKTFWL